MGNGEGGNVRPELFLSVLYVGNQYQISFVKRIVLLDRKEVLNSLLQLLSVKLSTNHLTKDCIERILEKWQSSKYQESLYPPRQQLHWQNLHDANYFGTLESTEGLQLPGVDLDSLL